MNFAAQCMLRIS
uniref:Uncharacterized protein n=1 Tax=Rhizophora mucronata TaxID=61149 RepID=A0A2P2JIG4_RHIMU